ncbi:MAG: hypothetical protein J2P45_07065 [Candidatus Dormibacteraeota bacterium]|nr:hypothetical protein [Candidatus Dormibacteraeota bacterium]
MLVPRIERSDDDQRGPGVVRNPLLGGQRGAAGGRGVDDGAVLATSRIPVPGVSLAVRNR